MNKAVLVKIVAGLAVVGGLIGFLVWKQRQGAPLGALPAQVGDPSQAQPLPPASGGNPNDPWKNLTIPQGR